MTGYAVVRLDDIDEIPDRIPCRPVRHHFGITSFGVNAWTAAAAGERVLNEHDEAGDSEELYLVHRGRATFELDGERVDAAGCGDCLAAVVAGCTGAGSGLRTGLAGAPFCRAQHAGDVSTSAVFLVGRPAHGFPDGHRADGQRSEAVRRGAAIRALSGIEDQKSSISLPRVSAPLPRRLKFQNELA